MTILGSNDSGNASARQSSRLLSSESHGQTGSNGVEEVHTVPAAYIPAVSCMRDLSSPSWRLRRASMSNVLSQVSIADDTSPVDSEGARTLGVLGRGGGGGAGLHVCKGAGNATFNTTV